MKTIETMVKEFQSLIVRSINATNTKGAYTLGSLLFQSLIVRSINATSNSTVEWDYHCLVSIPYSQVNKCNHAAPVSQFLVNQFQSLIVRSINAT